MSKSPLISIITIFFNAENFLQEAIESILMQTYKNWELILVNDGSTDSSKKIVLNYVDKLPEKIKYLEHEGCTNLGMSATRNLGIKFACGEYLAFLDADDVWLSNNLERQLEIVSAQPEVDVLYGSTRYWYSWTGNKEDLQKDFCDNLADLIKKPKLLYEPPELLILLLQESVAPCNCSLLIKLQLAKLVGGFEENFKGMYEDQVFLVKILLKAKVIVTNESYSLYRRHSNSCYFIAQKEDQEKYFRLLFLNWVESYLSICKPSFPELFEVLNKELLPYRNPTLYKIREAFRIFTPRRIISKLRSGFHRQTNNTKIFK